MKISIWKTMGLNPVTKVCYHVIIDPMTDDAKKVTYSTESKYGMGWFILKHFIKGYRHFLSTDKEFIEQSIVSAAKLKAQGIEATMVKKPHYRKKYKNNSK